MAEAGIGWLETRALVPIDWMNMPRLRLGIRQAIDITHVSGSIASQFKAHLVPIREPPESVEPDRSPGQVARRAREHNHCNVLCLGTDLLGEEQIRNIVTIFLNTPFSDGRHSQRITKIAEYEKGRCR